MGSSSRLQIRWRFTRLGLAISAAALAAGAAAVTAWPHAWPWVVAVAGVVAAGAPPALADLTAAQQRRADKAKAIRHGLQGTMGSAGDILPVVAQANLGARIHRAVLELPYVHRDAEDKARLHLTTGRPVLLVGPSMVGKSKMAVMLIQDMFSDRRVAMPDTREALASLDSVDVFVRGSVIFLDDINRLVGVGGITDGALRRLVTGGNIIIGTIRAAEYDRFQPTDQFRPPEWDALSVFERIFIGRELSDAEQQRLAEAIADPSIRERVRRVGLGEYAGSAERIVEALRLGPSVSPAGLALVLGAADWQRAGMSAPVPALALPDLAAPHLEARHHVNLSNGQMYAEALTWATRDINPTVALLQRAGPEGFMVYEYALDLLSEQSRPLPEATWPIVIHHATPSELLNVAQSAATLRQWEVAKQAWTKAAASGDADAAPMAMLMLGVTLAIEGDMAGARAAYQQAIDSGHANAASQAAYHLGELLEKQGDIGSARAAYQQAIDSGYPGVTSRAAIGLAVLLERQGNVGGARAAYQQAIDSEDPVMGPLVMYLLGELLERHGDMGGARAAYQQAIDSGNNHAGAMAALRLAGLLKRQGDVGGARAAYRQSIQFRRAADEEFRIRRRGTATRKGRSHIVTVVAHQAEPDTRGQADL